ncbi:glutamine synthetase [Arcticibacter tournemirensis]|uniref:Glutamine synthetase n=1 Tax=Arcticibacter tournemirensis TaxID=699437 RepID=A0A5M9HF96_9SPHI|nr:glutamine synthetase family protein [Arcticibacter tournemirensis]KAA8485035.1 glutamine synthetase [Arcticibacter tournemirensis]TQM50509.1 glutamine synthetase [Arcticibacter tournemirensis]
MDNSQVIKYLQDKDIHKIKFAFADIDGILRGKVIHRKKFVDGLQDGYGFCDVTFGWDSNDALYDEVAVTGWQSGFPDKACRIDLNTFRTVPWEDHIPFFLADFSRHDGTSLAVCPRSLLKRIIQQCDSMGFHAEFAQEFEWFNFKETSHSLQEKGFTGLQPLTSGMFGYSILRPSQNSAFFYDLFNLCEQFNIQIEGLHTETGPGVYEAAILHNGILEAADKAVLFKSAVKEIASRHGIVASFMAKWNTDLPGCSGHIHQSLWTKDKERNLFYDADNQESVSELLKQYIAGQLYCLPYILPMYAPTVNSYKRLVEGAWAPTTVSWGFDNRTVALRVLNPSEKYTRLETRVPGADTNPYLAMAAALASGLYGIRNKLLLDIPATTGNAYKEQEKERLPADLYSATQSMMASPVAKDLFGEEFTDHFTRTRLSEWNHFVKHVSTWELKRYLEII